MVHRKRLNQNAIPGLDKAIVISKDGQILPYYNLKGTKGHTQHRIKCPGWKSKSKLGAQAYERQRSKVIRRISHGSQKPYSIGSKSEVYLDIAKKTSGGLRKADLMLSKNGKIISKKVHAQGNRALRHLVKYHEEN